MRTGGIAEVCFFPETAEELCAQTAKLYAENKRFYVLGNMSNVLVPDGKTDFVPVITSKMNKTEISENADGSVSVYAEAGVSLTKLAYSMCRSGYGGLVFAYGIPGTVGGAVFMNAGAYGSEMSAVAEYVDCFDPADGKTMRFSNEQCRFGYRTSAFCENGFVILGAGLRLERADAETLTAQAKETMRRRAEKQPLEYPSCGSAFKRPSGYFAGELIEKCGLKGVSVGGAQVSEKHAGFIINKGGATTADVAELIALVQKKTAEKFGVELEAEIRILGGDEEKYGKDNV